ncbi:S-adenosyl-L-methionine-dependent methyltransferase [Podospora didyma]|uniref:S-adenosyl-L-methionine-dependent methyltransferase n=1 Tax=Podospora didyma TaxID=330526 RepID=A0AAE0NY05_9PEZI|nr:S-adenosyl-L-methionine-dependent methyltransferase [Podospora didyma]
MAPYLNVDSQMNYINQTSDFARADAINTLKAVQQVVNGFFAQGSLRDKGFIPTPEPSPIPRPEELAQAITNDIVGQNETGVLSISVPMPPSGDQDMKDGPDARSVVVSESGTSIASGYTTNAEPGINVPASAVRQTSNVTQAFSGGADRTASSDAIDGGANELLNRANISDASGPSSEAVAAADISPRQQQDEPPASQPPSGTEPKAPTPPHPVGPGATGSLSPERLRFLANQISCSVDEMSSPETSELARLRTVTAAMELVGAVRPPPDTIMSLFVNMSMVSAVKVFQSWRVFDIMPAGKGESISYAELAEKVNAEEALLIRMAWMLSSTGILRHEEPDRVAHTPTSMMLREDQPMGSMFKIMYTNVVEASAILPAYFETYGRREPVGPAHIPTSFLAGKSELEYFELLNQDPERVKMFMRAMAISNRRVPTLGMYEMDSVLTQAAEEPDRLAWVDVGGGNGHTLKLFRQAFPALRAEQCAVQDLPEVVEAAKELAENDELLRGVQWHPFNFHKQSPVKGALIYYLRHIARDYSDSVLTNILRNIAQSMRPDSRLLIAEQLTVTPPPVYSAFKDYAMLTIGGKERTLEQFNAVGAAAGLRVSGVFRDSGTPHAVVEFALANSD